MFFACGRGLIAAGLMVSAAAGAQPGDANSAAPAQLSAVQIVEQIRLHDEARNRELKHYEALRHYQVEYRGFSAVVAAKMDVKVNYDAAQGKRLEIVSQSGSKFLLEKVLKRAVDSEKEASQTKGTTSLSPEHYRFKLEGMENVGGRPAYVLDVIPLTESKFLYRGKVWVDAADFATVKMETEPAKSPSFWISRTLIHYTGAKTDGFWMPQLVRSETKVRIGGTAVLTIDYGTYRMEASAGR